MIDAELKFRMHLERYEAGEYSKDEFILHTLSLISPPEAAAEEHTHEVETAA
jgi:hypothetical protein